MSYRRLGYTISFCGPGLVNHRSNRIPRNLQVPEEIHNEWKKGGTSRQRLQELFATHNFDKAWKKPIGKCLPAPPYGFQTKYVKINRHPNYLCCFVYIAPTAANP